MPWRKYPYKEGKYGRIYQVARGIQVRCDQRGMWVVFLGHGERRKNKTIGPGREGLVKAIKAAEAISAKLKSALAEGKTVEAKSNSPKFGTSANAWLSGNEGKWDENTLERYEGILRIHLLPDPNIKGKRLDEITRSDVKKAMRALLKKRSAATVELAYTVFNGVFEEAVDEEILSANPAQRLLKAVLPPKAQRGVFEADPMTTEERDLFLEHAEKICTWSELLVFKVMAFAGFRLGEALAMRERNLDTRSMTYMVCEGYKIKRFNKPKKGKKRKVDLPVFLVEELQAYIRSLRKQSLQEGKGGEVDLLFIDPQENGPWPFSQRRIQGMMKRICRAAGLRLRNPHDLRHTYATIMLMAHQSPAYVQRQLGHSSISMTVDVYGHWISGQGREGLEDALLGGVRKPHIFAYEQERPR